jgi:hypothetical protein
VPLLTLSTLLVCCARADAASDVPNAGNMEARSEIDIPSQPLEDALCAFGSATGIEVCW